jgi:uncharacterized protein YbjT (DUF2867 family)
MMENRKDREEPAAFVAGATGFTGRAVVRALVDRGVPTVAHVRPDSPELARWREHFGRLGAQVDTTAWQEEAMAAALARIGPGCVFALLGTTRARGRASAKAGRVESYETVDYGLTALLIQALVKAKLAPRFVYLSAVGVKRDSGTPYYAARWKTEDLLRRSGLPWTIARPSFITGPGRDDPRPAERFFAAAFDGMLSVASILGARKVRDRYRSMTGVQLASALVRLAFDQAAEGKVAEPEDLR